MKTNGGVSRTGIARNVRRSRPNVQGAAGTLVSGRGLVLRGLGFLGRAGQQSHGERQDEDDGAGGDDLPNSRPRQEPERDGAGQRQHGFTQRIAQAGEAQRFAAAEAELARHHGLRNMAEQALAGEAQSHDAEAQQGCVRRQRYEQRGRSEADDRERGVAPQVEMVDPAAQHRQAHRAQQRAAAVEQAEAALGQVEVDHEVRQEKGNEKRLAKARRQSRHQAKGQDGPVGGEETDIAAHLVVVRRRSGFNPLEMQIDPGLRAGISFKVSRVRAVNVGPRFATNNKCSPDLRVNAPRSNRQ